MLSDFGIDLIEECSTNRFSIIDEIVTLIIYCTDIESLWYKRDSYHSEWHLNNMISSLNSVEQILDPLEQ